MVAPAQHINSDYFWRASGAAAAARRCLRLNCASAPWTGTDASALREDARKMFSSSRGRTGDRGKLFALFQVKQQNLKKPPRRESERERETDTRRDREREGESWCCRKKRVKRKKRKTGRGDAHRRSGNSRGKLG